MNEKPKALPILRYEDVYHSDYLAPDDLQDGQVINAVIADIDVRELRVETMKNIRATLGVTIGGKPAKKRVAVNKTSAKGLRRAWGGLFSDWKGHQVTIRRTLIKAFGVMTPAVLVEAVKGEPAKPTKAPVAPPTPEPDEPGSHDGELEQ